MNLEYSSELQTIGGQVIDLLSPNPDHIHWSDVFHAMSLENRYNGHTTNSFSIGQHTVAMANRMVQRPLLHRQVAFIHDMPEYILKDVTGPLKSILEREPAYNAMTIGWENAFCTKLGIDPIVYREVFTKEVKHYDILCYQAESYLFRPHSGVTCEDSRMINITAACAMMGPNTTVKTMHALKEELFPDAD